MALYRLMRDPQDTAQVFRLTEALRGRSTRILYEEFAATPNGAKILADRRSLLGALTNRAALAALPDGSFGRHYLSFMAQENLTAEGLVELAHQNAKITKSKDEGIALYAARMRDMHDLYHVLAGYGRDELGEICVLAFSYQQQKIRSFWVISWLGTFNIMRRLRRTGIGAAGVFAAVRQASRDGIRATWLPAEDLESMLGDDLAALRARLNIAPPTKYQQVVARINAFQKPKDQTAHRS